MKRNIPWVAIVSAALMFAATISCLEAQLSVPTEGNATAVRSGVGGGGAGNGTLSFGPKPGGIAPQKGGGGNGVSLSWGEPPVGEHPRSGVVEWKLIERESKKNESGNPTGGTANEATEGLEEPLSIVPQTFSRRVDAVSRGDSESPRAEHQLLGVDDALISQIAGVNETTDEPSTSESQDNSQPLDSAPDQSLRLSELDLIASGDEVAAGTLAKPAEAPEYAKGEPRIDSEEGAAADRGGAGSDSDTVEGIATTIDQAAGEGGGDTGNLSLDLEDGKAPSDLSHFVEALMLSPDLAQAKLEAEESCGEFGLEYYLDSPDGGGVRGLNFLGVGNRLTFVVIPRNNQPPAKESPWAAHDGNLECGAVGAAKCNGEGGISPDAHRGIRAALAREVGEANSALARGGILSIAARLASMETQSLKSALEFAEGRVESGTDTMAEVASLRAQVAAVEVDRAHLLADSRASMKKFEKLTGITFDEAWRDSGADRLWQTLGAGEDEIDFASIFALAAVTSMSTEDAARMAQEMATGVSGGRRWLEARSGVSSLADSSLRRTRSAVDSGRMDEGDDFQAQALMLRAQREEVVALSELAEAQAAAYPPVSLKVLPRSELPGVSKCSRAAPSWIPVAAATGAAFLLFLAAMRSLASRRKAN